MKTYEDVLVQFEADVDLQDDLPRAERVGRLLHEAYEAGRHRGVNHAFDECETCGCTGAISIDEVQPDCETVKSRDVACPECDGTGIGAMGEMMRKMRERGAYEALSACQSAERNGLVMKNCVDALVATYGGSSSDEVKALREKVATLTESILATDILEARAVALATELLDILGAA